MLSFFNKFSLRNKILSMLLFVMIIFSGFSLLLIQSIDDVNTVTHSIKRDNIPALVWYSQWEKELKIKKQLVIKQVEINFENDFQSDFNNYDTVHNTAVLQKEVHIPEELKSIQNQIMALDFTIRNKVFGLLEYQEKDAAKNVIETEYLPKLETLTETIVTKRNAEFNALQNNTGSYPKIIEQSLYFLLIITVAGFFISMCFSFKMSRNITKPIETMIEKVNKIANGNYGETISSSTQLEFQSLANSINQMSISLQQSFQQIIFDKRKHEQTLNSLPVGIITYDMKAKKYLANSYARDLLDLNQELINDNDIIEKQKQFPFLQKLLSDQSFQNSKFKLTIKEKQYDLLVSQSILKDHSKITTGKILYFIDITESAKLENRMIQSEKLALVGEMAASSAHEIRNPLTVIHGFLTLLKESLTKQEIQKYNIELMMKEIERLYSIVEQMLLMSNHQKPEKVVIKLSNLLEDLLPLMNNTLEAKNIKIKTNLTEQYLFADQKQIKQVFLNLIRNSKDAIEQNGEITIVSEVEGEKYIIYFSDTGSGIPSSIKQTLFEPFSTSKSNGTGLGLNVVCRIIKNHQGKIILYSSDQSGTTFKIVLPLN
ncbi:hypothetical protein JCM21714_227 [Gracilibacillus boraciitolerans JCM 21714]|uniref:histidine kinase n=1 Tax=Gracilibacillus boraciitolerans JCM 21714 TaxID=1298598 RepID=W4VDJ2_9BACI|nr:ATP-binding protein [Gracilibacillus boraciitolerans]GAE91282.1 hypothetical protein JCM21714_227 [Gracilibacillus boraciitolerans JCM 21714]